MKAWDTQAKLKAVMADGTVSVPTQLDILSIAQRIGSQRDRVLFLLSYLTAGRISEVIAIRAEDIQPTFRNDREVITIQMPNRKNKSKHSKIIPIPLDRELEKDLIAPVLEYAKNKQGPLFDIGKLRAWQIIRDTTGFNPHWLRHVRLTHLETTYGLRPEMLKTFAGWTDTRPAKNYLELNWGDILEGM